MFTLDTDEMEKGGDLVWAEEVDRGCKRSSECSRREEIGIAEAIAFQSRLKQYAMDLFHVSTPVRVVKPTERRIQTADWTL